MLGVTLEDAKEEVAPDCAYLGWQVDGGRGGRADGWLLLGSHPAHNSRMSERHWGSRGGWIAVALARKGAFPAGTMGVWAFRRATK